MKRTLSILLAAVMLLAVLPMAAQAATITRIDEFRFAANPNAMALSDTKTVGAWLNTLENSDNGIGKGVMAAADAEGWKVDEIWGVYDSTEDRLLKSDEYADLSHTNWLRVCVKLTDPENFAFNGDKSHTYTTYVNGISQGGAPLDIYSCIDIHLNKYAVIATAAFTVAKPQFGDQCSNYVPKVGGMAFGQAQYIKILSYSWCIVDPYTSWPEECTSFSDAEADYALILEFTTEQGYYFGQTGTVKVNGEEIEFSQHGDGEGNTVTRFKYHVSVKPIEKLSSVSATLTVPRAGEHPDMTPVPGDPEKYSVTVEYWYLSEEPYPHLEATDKFEEGKRYTVRLAFSGNDGYIIDRSYTTCYLNGEELTGGLYSEGENFIGRQKSFTAAAASNGSVVSGTVTSYLDESGAVTVQLLQGDIEKYSTYVTGNTVGYSIADVADGSYTLRVSKKNHAARDYDITVAGDTVLDAKICPVGDVNMSGTVTTMDVTMANSHVQKKSTLSGYSLKLADANNSDSITTMDVTMINSHVQKKSSLWK